MLIDSRTRRVATRRVADAAAAEPRAALRHAACRLRPIMMTTLAMIFGMVPLAFAITEGSEAARAAWPGR